MENKKRGFRVGFLAMTIVAAVLVGFAMVGAAVLDVTPAFTNGEQNTYNFNITNTEASDITKVLISGSNNFEINSCPSSIGSWQLISQTDVNCIYDWYSLAPNSSFEFSGILATPLSSGNLLWNVMFNENSSYNVTDYVYVDAEGPIITLVSPDAGSWHRNDFLVNWTWSDNNSLIQDCSVRIFNESDLVYENLTWDCGVSEFDELGVDEQCSVEGSDTCIIELGASDNVSNSAATNFSFSVDLTAPTSSVSSLPEVFQTSDLIADAGNYKINLTISCEDFPADGAGARGASVWRKKDDGNWSSGWYNFDSCPAYVVVNLGTVNEASGSWNFESVARDDTLEGSPRGNQETRNEVADAWTLVDVIEPDFNVTAPENVSWVDSELFYISTGVIVEDGSGVEQCYVVYYDSNSTYHTLGTLNYDGGVCSGEIAMFDNVTEGEGTLYVYVNDTAGNSGGGVGSPDTFITLSLDRGAPTIQNRSPEGIAISDGTYVFSVLACDNGSGINLSTTSVRARRYGDGYDWINLDVANYSSGDDCYIFNGTLNGSHEIAEWYVVDFSLDDTLSKNTQETWSYIFLKQATTSLDAGDNYASVPLYSYISGELNTSLPYVLGDVAPHIDVIYAYNASADAGDKWRIYRADNADLSDLSELVPGEGYIIHSNQSVNLVVDGTEMLGTPNLFELVGGSWNLIGFATTQTGQSIGSRILGSAAEFVDCDQVIGYDDGAYITHSCDSNITVGASYWVYALKDGDYV